MAFEWVVSAYSLPDPRLGPDTCRAAAGALWAQPGAGAPRVHTCPPRAARELGKVLGQRRSARRQPCSRRDRQWAVPPRWGLFGSTKRRNNPMSLKSNCHRIPTDVSSS